MIKCLVFLFCCIMPYAAEAGEILNVQDGFQLVKAVKLGRGNAYSVTADSSLNTGAGITKISKRCSSGCSDCDTTTGTCNACSGGYYNAGGTCIACSTIPVSNGTCTYCMGDEDYVSCEGAQCNTGYWDESGTCKTCGYAIDNCAECNSTGSTCTKCNDGYTLANNECFASNACSSIPDYNCYTINPDLYVGWLGEIGVELCANIFSEYGTMQHFAMADPTESVYENGNCTPTCSAGTYVSGSNCVTCPDGTYSTGSNQGSCRPCSDILVNIGSNQYVNCSTCSSTGSCTYYSCPAGYYWKKSGGCAKCPDGCSACSDSSAGVYCTACSTAYYVSGSNGSITCINSDGSSGCPAGYYLSGSSNCVACSSGTWSSGGTATSCSSCSTITIYAGGSNITCTSCTTTGTCTGSNGGSSSSSPGSSCNSGGATATSPTNCPQGYGWGGSGCVTSSSQCKVCGQGSSLGGYCNCPAGSPSDGRGGCGGRCSYPYSNYCSSGQQSGKCCRSSSDCYYGNNGNCR